MSKGGSFTVPDIELLKSLAASMKSVWEKISRSLFTLKLHVLLDHCLTEDIDYAGTPWHWSASGFESLHRRLQLRVDQNVTNCQEILVKNFLLKKELTGLLEIEAERNGDESFVRLRKAISEGASNSRLPPLLHLARRWRVSRHSQIDWASLVLIHDVEISAAHRGCKLSSRLCHDSTMYASKYYWKRRKDTIQHCVWFDDEGCHWFGDIVVFWYNEATLEAYALLEQFLVSYPFNDLGQLLRSNCHPAKDCAMQALSLIRNCNSFFKEIAGRRFTIVNAYKIRGHAGVVSYRSRSFVTKL